MNERNLKIQKYVTDKSKSRTLIEAHYHLCLRNNHPYIYIHASRKYAMVVMQLDETDREITPEGQKKIREIFIRLGAWDTRVSAILGSTDKIEISKSDELANGLFEIARLYSTPKK